MIHGNPFIFFGSAPFSIVCLEALRIRGVIPELIVSLPDAPQGRGQILRPNVVTAYAQSHGIEVITPEKIKDNQELQTTLASYTNAVILVAAYGKIIPDWMLALSPHGILNIHPSLLPKYRGPSPIQSQILADDPSLGVTIMRMDSELDHGPIIASRPVMSPSWPIHNTEAEELLGTAGAILFVDTIDDYLANGVTTEQDHGAATFTKKFTKQDGLIAIHAGRSAMCLFCALHRDPGCYYFDKHNDREVRIKIGEAKLEDNTFIPVTVTPEGKKPMAYDAYLRGKRT